MTRQAALLPSRRAWSLLALILLCARRRRAASAPAAAARRWSPAAMAADCRARRRWMSTSMPRRSSARAQDAGCRRPAGFDHHARRTHRVRALRPRTHGRQRGRLRRLRAGCCWRWWRAWPRNEGALPPQCAAAASIRDALRAAIEAGTQRAYARFTCRGKLWSRLNAAAAGSQLPMRGAATPADCCFHARVLDWMRVASLLVQDGRFEGKRWCRPAGCSACSGRCPPTACGVSASNWPPPRTVPSRSPPTECCFCADRGAGGCGWCRR